MSTRTLRRVLGGLLCAWIAHAAAEPQLTPFTGTYAIQHGAMQIGESTFALHAGDANSYVLESRTNPKGVAKLICVIKVKTGEDGKMFGTVTAGMIADELKHQFDITLDKRKIHLAHPIRTLGEQEVELRLHHEVNAMLKLRIESTNPLPTATEAPAPEGRVTEKRGKGRHAEAEAAPAEETEKKPKAAKAEKAPKAEKPAKKAKADKAE